MSPQLGAADFDMLRSVHRHSQLFLIDILTLVNSTETCHSPWPVNVREQSTLAL